MSSCDEQSCSFGGICVALTENHLSDVCLCDFNCSTADDMEAVCASDGNVYNSTCFMDVASCKQQKSIYQITPIHLCHYNGSSSDVAIASVVGGRRSRLNASRRIPPISGCSVAAAISAEVFLALLCKFIRNHCVS